MFDHSEPFGSKVNVLNSCALFLVDAISTQATGSRQYTAPSSRMTVGTTAARWSLPLRLPLLPCRGADGAWVSAPSTRVSAIRASPSLEDALVAHPEQEVRADEH